MRPAVGCTIRASSEGMHCSVILSLRSLSRWGMVGLVLAILPRPAIGQGQGANGYPNAERRVGLTRGDTVTLLNRFVHDNGPAMRPPGRRLDLQYSTLIPRTDSLARLEQADRAAQFFGPQAIELGVRRLSIG